MNNLAYEINKEFDRIYRDYRKTIKEYPRSIEDEDVRKFGRQLPLELDIVRSDRVCEYDNNNYLKKVNSDNMMQLLLNNFAEDSVMRSVKCVIDDLLSSLTFDRDRLDEYTTNPVKFGDNASSVNGDVMTFSVASYNDLDRDEWRTRRKISSYKMFVLKVPKSNTGSNELVHEACVGIMLNALRRDIPNFAYVYGATSCSAPIFKGNDAISWCEDSSVMKTYCIYENIQNSIPFMSIQKTCSYSEFVSYIYQVMLSIYHANNQLGFIHNDLHTENVLIRLINQKKSIRYSFDGKDIYIKTNGGVSTIIDYGMSTYVKDGREFLYHDNKGVISRIYEFGEGRDNIVRDAFKFLSFIISEFTNIVYSSQLLPKKKADKGFIRDFKPLNPQFNASNGRFEKVKDYEKKERFLSNIMKFFYGNGSTVENMHLSTNALWNNGTFYVMSRNISRNFNMKAFLKYILKLDSNLTMKAPTNEYPSLQCSNQCLPSSTIDKVVYSSDNVTYFTAYDSRNGEDSQKMLNAIKQNFEVISFQENKNIDQIFNYKVKPYARLYPQGRTYTKTTKSLEDSTEFYNNIRDARKYINILTYLSEEGIYKDKRTIDDLYKHISNLYPLLKKQVDYASIDIKYLKDSNATGDAAVEVYNLLEIFVSNCKSLFNELKQDKIL